MSAFIPPVRTIVTAAVLLVATGCSGSDSTGPALVTLLLVVETVGEDLDTDGYQFVLDDGIEIALPVSGEAQVENLARRNHPFTIRGVAENCRVTNQPTSGSIPLFGNVTVGLVVFCLQPDPGRFIYSAVSGGIQTRNALGADPQTLSLFGNSVSGTRDGARIAYEFAGDIWVAQIDGSNPVNITNTTASTERRPTWSPDGNRIIYDLLEGSGGTTRDVYVMNDDGSGVTNLTPDTPDSNDIGPAWSPDGTRIVFGSDRGGTGGLYTSGVDGTNVVQLTEGAFDGNARWSPDGEHVVFARFLDPAEEGTDFELFRIQSDGAGLTQLTDNAGFRTTDADWSPDGKWMVIASVDLLIGISDLYAMRADGSDIVRLTVLEGASVPRWLP